MSDGFQVVTTIDGAHPRMPDYPLLPEDIVVLDDDGTWFKECPGIAVSGFHLTDEQVASLKPIEFNRRGLLYEVIS